MNEDGCGSAEGESGQEHASRCVTSCLCVYFDYLAFCIVDNVCFIRGM